MDQGDGTFKYFATMDELVKAHPEKRFDESGVFSEGEVVEIKGSKFEVSKIIRNGLKLRLLPK